MPHWGERFLNIKNKMSHRKLRYPSLGTNSKIWCSLKYLNVNGREKCKLSVSISLDQDSVVSQFSHGLANLRSGETLWRQEMWGWMWSKNGWNGLGLPHIDISLTFPVESTISHKEPSPLAGPSLSPEISLPSKRRNGPQKKQDQTRFQRTPWFWSVDKEDIGKIKSVTEEMMLLSPYLQHTYLLTLTFS